MTRLKKLQETLCNTINYITPLLPFTNCHLVGFITEDLWTKLVPFNIRNEVETVGLKNASEMFWAYYNNSPEKCQNVTPFLAEYLNSITNICVHFEKEVCTSLNGLNDELEKWRNGKQSSIHFSEFMSAKKMHEVEMMGEIISAISHLSTTHIVDVGDGKGYLSSMLALQYGLKVLGLDSSQVNTRGAAKRTLKLQKAWSSISRKSEAVQSGETPVSHGKHWKSKNQTSEPKKICSSVCPIKTKQNEQIALYKQATVHVTPETDISSLLTENFEVEGDPNILLAGLHTCGNLAPTCLQLFVNNKNIHSICNVGCCYHLIDEHFSNSTFFNSSSGPTPEICGFPMCQFLLNKKFSLGRNARMLSAQSMARIIAKEVDMKKSQGSLTINMSKDVTIKTFNDSEKKPFSGKQTPNLFSIDLKLGPKREQEKACPTESLFYRALLEFILVSKYQVHRPTGQVGRLASKCKSFSEYVTKSVVKLDLNIEVNENEIESAMLQHSDERERLEFFFMLRAAAAPIIEIIILIDRLLYLLEQGMEESHVVQLFNPVISPRCYGILSLKKDPK